MESRKLSLFLAMLTTVLLIGPVVMALSSQGWELESLFVLPEEDMADIEERMTEFQNPGDFRITSEDLDTETGDFEVHAEFDSSVDFDILLRKFYAEVYLQEEAIGEVWLEDAVVFEAGEVKNFKLIGFIEDEFIDLDEDFDGEEDEIPDELIEEFMGDISGWDQDDYIGDMGYVQFENISVEIEVMGIDLLLEDIIGVEGS